MSSQDRYDWDLMAAVIRRQIISRGLRTPEGLLRASGFGREGLFAILAEEPSERQVTRRDKMKTDTINTLDSHLGLPYEGLITIGAHRWDLLAEMGAPADLIEFARLKLRNSGETGTDSAVAR